MEEIEIEKWISSYKRLVYGISLTRTGNKFDADEVFQDVFLTLYRKNPHFNDDEHRKAWLINCTLNFCKKKTSALWKKRTVFFEEVQHKGDFRFQLPEENDLFFELSQLPEKYRTVLYLYYFERYAAEEIAELLKIRAGTVRMQLNRGRELLKIKLGGERNESEAD